MAGDETGTADGHAERLLAYLLRPLSALLADPAVTEILVNGPQAVWQERAGCLQAVPIVLAPSLVATLARALATLARQPGFAVHGILETAWQEWRVTAVLPPVARDHALLCLRRHRAAALPLQAWGVSPGARAGDRAARAVDDARTALYRRPPSDLPSLLTAVVASRCNVLISGGTGTGKTSLLASLMAQIGAGERLLTLEDTPELPVACAHQVRLLASAGQDLRALLRLALRLRPDRLVVGEVRGSEAFDLLQAMATGHAGSMGTLHADHAMGALARLEQLVLTTGLAWPVSAVRQQIASCIEVLVQVQRTGGGRQVTAVHQLTGLSGDGEYRLVPLWPRVGARPGQRPPPGKHKSAGFLEAG